MKTSSGYARIQIGLHWAIVALIGVEYIVSDGMGRALYRLTEGIAPTGLTPVIHVWVGVTVLALVVLRIGTRLVLGAPPAPEGMEPRLKMLSHWTHILLYTLILAIPALGAVAWFGQVHWAGDVHSALFNVLMALVALHVVGALYHHYVVGDDVMERMVPHLKTRKQA